LPDNSILITADMQSETGFPSSHQLKSYVASKSRLKLAARAILSADAGLLVCLGDICLLRNEWGCIKLLRYSMEQHTQYVVFILTYKIFTRVTMSDKSKAQFF